MSGGLFLYFEFLYPLRGILTPLQSISGQTPRFEILLSADTSPIIKKTIIQNVHSKTETNIIALPFHSSKCIFLI